MKGNKLRHILVFGIAFVLLALQPAPVSRGADPTPEPESQILAENLLQNPSMEEGFYWKYPNHFVANNWRRWWVGNVIPEYDDAREWRPWTYDGKHAQIYFWYWNVPYTAGIFQQVQVQPCTLYQFSMYGRNHSQAETDHHARIGIDPLGRKYTLYMTSLPTDIVWSPEQTFFYQWGLHTVTAESLGETLTAITHVSPDPNKQPYDTFWDAATLVPLPFPDDILPEPDSWTSSSFIYNVTTQLMLDDMIVEWDTRAPASTQIWYTVTPYSPPPPQAPVERALSTQLTPTLMPMTPSEQVYSYTTPLVMTPTTHHRASITNLDGLITLEFALMARHPTTPTCTTEMYGPLSLTFKVPQIWHVYLPLTIR